MSETLPEPELVEKDAITQPGPNHCHKGNWSTLLRAILYAPVLLSLAAGIALAYFPQLAEQAASFVLPEHDREAGCNGTACHCPPETAKALPVLKK